MSESNKYPWTEPDPASAAFARKFWICLLLTLMLLFVYTVLANTNSGWFFESAADKEAAVFKHMEKSGASFDRLCVQAAATENEYAREGNEADASHWANMRQSVCISASACRAMVGGCSTR